MAQIPARAYLLKRRFCTGRPSTAEEEVDGGTVFEISTTGVEKVLHRFGYDGEERYSNDGENPVASLIDVNGRLYGTTYNGGSRIVPERSSGSAHAVKRRYCTASRLIRRWRKPGRELDRRDGYLVWNDTAWRGNHGLRNSFQRQYNRHRDADPRVWIWPLCRLKGAYPDAGLINVKGTLYGTTANSGGWPWWNRFQRHTAVRSWSYMALEPVMIVGSALARHCSM